MPDTVRLRPGQTRAVLDALGQRQGEQPDVGCARCGDCCRNITTSWEPEDLLRWATSRVESLPDPSTDEGWAVWRQLTSATDDERATLIARWDPNGVDRRNADFIEKNWTVRGRSAWETQWSCAAFDEDTNLCTAHDDRPPICEGYPWYGDTPGSAVERRQLPNRCSYWRAVPEEKWPEGVVPLPFPTVR